FGGILGPVALMFGLTRTAGATASLMLNLESVLTALIAWLIFKENADRRIVLGMITIVVTNPEVSSVRDSDRMLGLLASKSKRAEEGQDPIKEHLLLTRYNPERVSNGEMLGVEDVKEILAVT
ncbi:EamA family transporter, partial [Klebsiella pneumoniae]|uniref:EamA family transporter n=1 Tax=Klebsiella pneumoniae TaxID=573 RepID=UPI002731C3D5